MFAFRFQLGLGSFRYSFICQRTVPVPRDSEVTFSVFDSSYHLLLPV